ncbi:MAG: WYL domain-containing transcriptional regulator [bacterium]|nr:WYL domain-containing transcriptional regulator [bacterium]
MAQRLEYKLFEAMVYIHEGQFPGVEQLAQKLGCSRRTAERYLERIRLVVADDLVYNRTRRGYCFKSGKLDLPAFRLTEGEAIALFLGGKLLDQCRGTPYKEHVAEALRKICTYLARDVTYADVARPAGWISFAVGSLRGDEEQVLERFTRVHRAIQDRETLRVVYFAVYRGGLDQREIDPYHLYLHSGVWYAFAHCHTRKEVRIFALDRIHSIEGTGRRFERSPDFSPQAFVSDSFGIERGEPVDVAIRFQAAPARYVRERIWHSSQTVEELGDGGLILRLRVGGLGEVRRWVLSYGAGAEVLAPPELRDAVRRETKGLAEVYRHEG